MQAKWKELHTSQINRVISPAITRQEFPPPFYSCPLQNSLIISPPKSRILLLAMLLTGEDVNPTLSSGSFYYLFIGNELPNPNTVEPAIKASHISGWKFHKA